jgi:hypothetical protein
MMCGSASDYLSWLIPVAIVLVAVQVILVLYLLRKWPTPVTKVSDVPRPKHYQLPVNIKADLLEQQQLRYWVIQLRHTERMWTGHYSSYPSEAGSTVVLSWAKGFLTYSEALADLPAVLERGGPWEVVEKRWAP